MTPLSTFSAHLSVIVVYSLLPSNLNIPPWRCVCNAKKLSYSAGKRSIRGRYTVHARSWCTARQELNTHTHTHTHTHVRAHTTHTPQKNTHAHTHHIPHTHHRYRQAHTHHIPHTHHRYIHTLITFHTHTPQIQTCTHSSHSTHTPQTYSSHSTHTPQIHTHIHHIPHTYSRTHTPTPPWGYFRLLFKRKYYCLHYRTLQSKTDWPGTQNWINKIMGMAWTNCYTHLAPLTHILSQVTQIFPDCHW